MANAAVPTKGNLLATKKSLQLSRTGYELLDRKRNILIREMMQLIDRANSIQTKIDGAYTEAYAALQTANITLGICKELAATVPLDTGLNVAYRSVMGVEIPMVELEKAEDTIPVPFGLFQSNTALDMAYQQFQKVKELTAELAEVENSVYRLADAIKKTQKRANALKNIMIPRFTATVKFITEALEEKDREEFSRMKIIKAQKQKAQRLAEEETTVAS
ncbi:MULTISPECIES: V-type ATP synthase subunit D [Caproicibacterium]|uniref:V-type ATP synthase subunit D n=1 Tax=Caproicibacterium argilliputei TaxID=3030016 RepID=A0AA97DD50_9FIRM|nr:V-type ATP synthase subunit D [Caproicibacterium argilliputei]WOC33276.1 V-type ATP synthase subunit D [Caproicibacterium argilliputei]